MKLGEHLVTAGVIDRDQLEAGLAHAAATGRPLGSALIALGHANGDQVAAALAKQHGVAAAKDRHLAAATTGRLPASVARAHHAVIVGEGRDRELVIAMHNPLDTDALRELEQATGRVVTPAVASLVRLDETIARLYSPGGSDIATAAAAAAAANARPKPMSTPGFQRSAPTVDLGPRAPMGSASTVMGLGPEGPRPAPSASANANATVSGLGPEGPRPAHGATATVSGLGPEGPRPASRALDLETPAALELAPPGESVGLAMGSAPEMTPLPPSTPTPKPRTTTGTMPATRRMPPVAGGTSLSASRGIHPLIKLGAGVAVMAAVAFFTYSKCSSEPSWAIKSDYTSSYVRAHLPLPGTGWRGHESLLHERKQGEAWARVEGVYRGGTADNPDEGLLAMRVHAPGQFPDEVDMEAFRRQLDGLARSITNSANDLNTIGLDCAIDSRVRSEPAGRCRGSGTFRGETINLYMYYWEDSVDDVFAVIYVSKGKIEEQLEPLEAFIHQIEVQ